MAKIKKMEQDNETIYPITHEDAVLDSDGVSIGQKIKDIESCGIEFLDFDETEAGNIEDNIAKRILNIERKLIEINVVEDLLCDKNGEIDCTNILQNTINEYKNEGVCLFFPKGIYKHTGLVLHSNICIKGENPDTTLLKNVSSTNDSIAILGENYYWPQEYFIKDISVTSDVFENDNRKAINNYINRNFIYDNVKINNHGYGLYEKGSWYSQHVFLDIKNCRYGIYLDSNEIPGTPNSFENCIIRDCDYNFFIGVGTDSLNFNGGHIGSSKVNLLYIDNTLGYNCRNIRFESVNFEGGLGQTDVVLGNYENTKGFVTNVSFENCRFAQWNKLDSKIGIDIGYGIQNVSLKDCNFIGYSTCVKSSSSFYNKELIAMNCNRYNCDNAIQCNNESISSFSPICGINKNKLFDLFSESVNNTVNISSLVTLNYGTQYKNCKKYGNNVTIAIRTNSEEIPSGETIIGHIDDTLKPDVNVVCACVGLNGAGNTIQAYGQVIVKINGDIQVSLNNSCSYLAFNISYNL